MEQTQKTALLSLPPLAVGYILAVLFVVGAAAIGIVWPQAYEAFDEGSDTNLAELILTLVWLPGFIYWLICVNRIHKVIYSLTGDTYPITPGRAVWFHFIPFYNLYWIFKWTSEAVKFINVNSTDKRMSPTVPGVLLLIGFLIGDGIGLILMFIALRGIMQGIKKAIEFPVAEAAQGQT
ncbi:MAG: hypothetical protein JW869_06200 [Candidatus Omnitrophica bacterium]|nr:hypothetical protein [Candidatus Omnitrophota bacterium]